jgi:hypothetical protein
VLDEGVNPAKRDSVRGEAQPRHDLFGGGKASAQFEGQQTAGSSQLLPAHPLQAHRRVVDSENLRLTPEKLSKQHGSLLLRPDADRQGREAAMEQVSSQRMQDAPGDGPNPTNPSSAFLGTHDHSTDRVSMSPNGFRRAVQDICSAMIDGVLENGSGHRVVDNNRD